MSYSKDNLAWLGTIPDHWQVSKLRQVLSPFSEKNHPDMPLLSVVREKGVIIRNVESKEENHNYVPDDLSNYKLVKQGQFTMNKMKAWQGSYGVSKYDGIVSPAYFVFNFKCDINRDFFNAAIRSKAYVSYFGQASDGIRVGQWDLSMARMKDIPFLVPPREEQDQIVRFLDWKVSSINRLINIKQEPLRKVKELLDRLFRDTTSKCSKKVKIKYLFELDDDFFVPDASESYAKAGMYNRGRGIFLREPCLGNELGDSQFQHIHSDRLMLSGQFAWEDAVYITQEKDTHGIASHRYYLLKPVRYIPVEYLWLYFLSGEGFFNLQQCSHGSAGRNRPLNIKEVLNLELPVPDDKEKANALNELVRDYMRLQVITEEEKKALLDFKTHLVADIVTGKIDVRGIKIPEYEFVDEDADADNEDDGEEDTEEQED